MDKRTRDIRVVREAIKRRHGPAISGQAERIARLLIKDLRAGSLELLSQTDMGELDDIPRMPAHRQVTLSASSASTQGLFLIEPN